MGAGVTEEDLVIILKREMADELARIGLDLGTTEKINAFRDDLVYMRTERLRKEKREDIVRNTLLALLITAAAYAVFQGARYYLLNGLDQGQNQSQKPQKSGVLYEHPQASPAAYVALDSPRIADARRRSGAIAAATAGHPVQGEHDGAVRGTRLLDRP